MLSAHLAVGDISVRRIWQVTEQALEAGDTRGSATDVEKFFAELGWREFAYHLLYHYPTLASVNYQPKFNAFPWEKEREGTGRLAEGPHRLPDRGCRHAPALADRLHA